MLEIDRQIQLPDPVSDSAPSTGRYLPLNAVGMSQIEVPIWLQDQTHKIYRTVAIADAYVNLMNSASRGIHMSRLYNLVQEICSQGELSFSLMQTAVNEFLLSHKGLSDWACFEISFSALISRKSLVSQNEGWRSYPVKMKVEKQGEIFRYFLEVLVTYSSTCPASAALARQLVQKKFDHDFSNQKSLNIDQIRSWLGSDQGIIATPHAQRSYAKVAVELNSKELLNKFDYLILIDLIEEALGTPVQTAVKREDEQEFALRNGQNLMFCEDAARKVQFVLNSNEIIKSYSGEFRHVESLHPHDAVARILKK